MKQQAFDQSSDQDRRQRCLIMIEVLNRAVKLLYQDNWQTAASHLEAAIAALAQEAADMPGQD